MAYATEPYLNDHCRQSVFTPGARLAPLDPALALHIVSRVKLSLRGEYALRALIVLGLSHGNDVVRIQAISEQQNIPKKFLEQILNDLRAAGILESRRGITGGYRLRRSPEQVTLGEIIRLIEGPLAPVSCVSEKFYERCSCPDEEKCGIRSIMKEVRDAISAILDRVTLAQLCERVKTLQGTHNNPLDYVI